MIRYAHRSRRVGLALFAGVAVLCVGAEEGGARPEQVLFGRANGFGRDKLTLRQVEARVVDGALRIEAATPGEDRGVIFPLGAAQRDLSSWREVEIELSNPTAAPITFTFWALSGHGWGGSSVFSTSRSSREILAPGVARVFRVNLHARYSGSEVYTKAVDPAALRCLELVLNDLQQPVTVLVKSIRVAGTHMPDTHDVSHRISVPDVAHDAPAAGRRVYHHLPGWENTSVTHVLTLPRDWAPGRRFPIIVEYTGNIHYHRYCHSTGRADQGNLAYGLARGEGFICLNLPFISPDGKREQANGWGDIDKGVEYCLAAIEDVVARFGGDRDAIFYTGFSRGSYASNYLALRNDRIARIWRGFITLHNPGQPWAGAGQGWNEVGIGWTERAARLNGRPWFHVPADLGREVHADVEYLEDRPSTVATRRWLFEQVASPASAKARAAARKNL